MTGQVVVTTINRCILCSLQSKMVAHIWTRQCHVVVTKMYVQLTKQFLGAIMISGCYHDNQMYILQFAKRSDGHFVDMVMTSDYSSDSWTCVVQLTKQSDGKFVDAIMTSGCYRDNYMYVIQLTKQSDGKFLNIIMVLFKKSFL